jgi:Protein of unknown function (DUF3800)
MRARLPRETVLWISDKGPREAAIKTSLLILRLAQKFEQEGPGLPHWVSLADSTISQIADTIYFGHSEESRLLQLADVCCSTVALHLRDDPVARPYYRDHPSADRARERSLVR